MLLFQERKKIRRILYSKITLAFLLIVLIFVSRGTWQIYGKAMRARAEKDKAAQELAEIEMHTAELVKNIERLKSERGIEEEIRHRFPVARAGEEVVVVVDENDKKSKDSETVGGQSLWTRFLDFFK
ncbi:MAG: hypothetical protein HY228_03090 [Candidatus Yonathbacteria bacterium]|nr:hypothetical protein [Candidatus Yonathbacteria bacterium]